MNIDHIGIAVKDLSLSIELYNKILNSKPIKIEKLINQKVDVAFYKGDNGTKIELLQPSNNESPISKFLEKKGEGTHHIALAVDDIYKEIDRMIELGFIALQETPSIGADNKLVFFFHPKTTGGVLIELCQKIEK